MLPLHERNQQHQSSCAGSSTARRARAFNFKRVDDHYYNQSIYWTAAIDDHDDPAGLLANLSAARLIS